MSLPRYRDPLEAAGPDTSDEVLRNKLRSNNWDGAGSLPTVDSTATEGYLLDPATGIAQFQVIYIQGQTAPAGSVGSATKTTDQGGISTSEVDVAGLSVTFTAVAARIYKVSALLRCTYTASAGVGVVRITDGSNTSLAASVHTHGGSESRTHSLFVVQNPGAGSVTYKVRAVTGTGTMTAHGSSTAPGIILVEDIGA